MTGRLADRVAVVTGAGSGIGRASSLIFAREGAQVVAADIDSVAAEKTAALIREAGVRAVAVPTDVSQSEQVREMAARAAGEWGHIDILHNNAGVAVRHTVTDQDEGGWDRCLAVNVKGAYLCSKYVIPHMLAHGGSIVHTASVTGIVGVRNRAAYSATKGALYF